MLISRTVHQDKELNYMVQYLYDVSLMKSSHKRSGRKHQDHDHEALRHFLGDDAVICCK